jgi:hypothetical protein
VLPWLHNARDSLLPNLQRSSHLLVRTTQTHVNAAGEEERSVCSFAQHMTSTLPFQDGWDQNSCMQLSMLQVQTSCATINNQWHLSVAPPGKREQPLIQPRLNQPCTPRDLRCRRHNAPRTDSRVPTPTSGLKHGRIQVYPGEVGWSRPRSACQPARIERLLAAHILHPTVRPAAYP